MTLDEIEKLCNEATLGPWTYETCYGVATITAPTGDVAHAVEYLKTTDADFIADARTLIPKLLEVAKAAELTQTYCSQPLMSLPMQPCGYCAQCKLREALAALEAE